MVTKYPGDIRILVAHLLPALVTCCPVTVIASGSLYATFKYTKRLVSALNANNIPWSFD